MRVLYRWVAPTLIAAVVTAGLVSLRVIPLLQTPLVQLDDALYDSLYRWRPVEDRQRGDLVVVAIDQKSLDEIERDFQSGWPWPRKYWGSLAEYLTEDCHARAVVFDMLFVNRSANGPEDDAAFAKAIDRSEAQRPGALVFATERKSLDTAPAFAPPVKSKPALATVNISNDGRWRTYLPAAQGVPTLATATLHAAGLNPKLGPEEFRLHFYGPHVGKTGRQTFRYVNAASVLAMSYDPSPETAAKWHLDPELFRDKIVLVGAIATGLYDMKAVPLGDQCPGVEVHATAIENMIHGDEVRSLGLLAVAGWTACATWLAAVGVVFAPRAWAKVLVVAVVWGSLLAVAAALFVRHDIIFARPGTPLVAVILTTVFSFAWSYFGEDRQRRRLLKALSSVVSPHIAEELASDPTKLAIGAERREMTVMFSDIKGFTDLSESLAPEQLANLLNLYLEEMSAVVLGQSGTLDKYIGDAIMSFWNAPLSQPNHAMLACRAALRMVAREAEIQPRLRDMGARVIATCIGINTGPMAVGFTGSRHLVNYTVLGDSVNLASRLEGTNRLYGTKIMVSQSTAAIVKDMFVLRRVDVVRVKGKLEPIALYELIAEAPAEASINRLVSEYERALQRYQQQQWEEAMRILGALQVEFPEDVPVRVLLSRVKHYQAQPPAAGWDGVYAATTK